MIEVIGLTKKYGDKTAVDNISFTINEGEIVGFLGPNGAGKTTTMNMLTGYISCTDGVAKIGGIDILENPIEAKKKIGYLPEMPPLYMDMTVKDYLDFVFDLKKLKGKIESKLSHIMQVCDTVKITDVYDRVIKNLSKGYKQRVGFAGALLGNPEVLILDEPTVGLDPRQIIEIRNLIKGLGKKHTIILSSHILPEVQAVCERVIVISKGKIVADDKTQALADTVLDNGAIIARISGDSASVLKVLRGLDGIKSCDIVKYGENNECEYEITVDGNSDIKKPLFRLCAENDWYLLESRSKDMSLEDIFIKITK